MTRSFCASCLAEGGVLALAEHDGKQVTMCAKCLRGDLRTGRWSFDEDEHAAATSRGGRHSSPAAGASPTASPGRKIRK